MILGYLLKDEISTSRNKIYQIKQYGCTEILFDYANDALKKRKGFPALLQRLQSNLVSKLIIWDISDLGSFKNIQNVLMAVALSHCNLIVIYRKIDNFIEEDKAKLYFLREVIAATEKRRITKLAKGIQCRWSDKSRAGFPVFGYKIENDYYEFDTVLFLCDLNLRKDYSKYDLAKKYIEIFLKEKSYTRTLEEFYALFGINFFSKTGLKDWLAKPALRGKYEGEGGLMFLATHKEILSESDAAKVDYIKSELIKNRRCFQNVVKRYRDENCF